MSCFFNADLWSYCGGERVLLVCVYHCRDVLLRCVCCFLCFSLLRCVVVVCVCFPFFVEMCCRDACLFFVR